MNMANASAFDRLTAADIMHTDVLTVEPTDTLQEAMLLMTENHVTGLPVLDRKERCVGVITATDILNYEQDHSEETSEANAELARHFNPETQRWEHVRVSAFALEEFAEVPVSEIMCRELISVEPSASLRDVARKMVADDVHRVLVLDREQYLLGIIAAMDFVRLFASRGEAT